VEQFCKTRLNDEDSWEVHEEILKNSEDFYQQLYIVFVDDAVAGHLQELSWFKMLTFFKQSSELQ
jgi:seryl-tRNA synthetase